MPRTDEIVAPRRVANDLVLTVAVFAAYFIAGKLGQATTGIRSSNLGPVWPAYGVALAAVLLCGSRVWFGIAASAFLVAFSSPVSHLAAAGQAAGATLAVLAGAGFLRHVAKFDVSLSRLRDALSLIVFGALGSAMVSSLIGIAVLYATGVRPYSGLSRAWLIYWLGDSTGVLLVTPLILSASTLLAIRARHRFAEFGALLLLLTGACFIIFGDLSLGPVKLHVLAFAVLPFVIWAAIRFGVGGVALSTLLIASIATIETALGSGPFAQNSPFINAVLLDVFFAVLSVSGLTLATVIAEREQAESERARLVRAQAVVEARLRLASIVESTDDAIIGEDVEGTITDWNNGAERLYGYSAREAIGKAASLLVPPDQGRNSSAVLTGHDPINHHEAEYKRKDGTRIQVSLTRSLVRDLEGRILGASVIARDITARTQAEEALANMSRRLIQAQDDERARIARELHDDIVQRLALLTIGLDQLQQSSSDLPGVRERTIELQRQAVQITSDIQALSHKLHSSRLHYLDLGTAIGGFCEEFKQQQNVEVDFRANNLPSSLSPDVSLCLFRVVQEALRNSATHSRVGQVEVQLWGAPDEIHLKVSDRGVGFRPDATTIRRGIGLSSMKERVNLVRGVLSINSQPGQGTTIHARVPLTSEGTPLQTNS